MSLWTLDPKLTASGVIFSAYWVDSNNTATEVRASGETYDEAYNEVVRLINLFERNRKSVEDFKNREKEDQRLSVEAPSR